MGGFYVSCFSKSWIAFIDQNKYWLITQTDLSSFLSRNFLIFLFNILGIDVAAFLALGIHLKPQSV